MNGFHDLERFLIVGITPHGTREPIEEILGFSIDGDHVDERVEHLEDVHPDCEFEVERVT